MAETLRAPLPRCVHCSCAYDVGGQRKLIVATPGGPVPDWFQTLEDRSYTTYKARLAAAARLRHLDTAWNLALIALSTATVIAAVGIMVSPALYGAEGELLLAVISIATLVTSLIVAGARFGARSRDMTVSYRRLQRFSVDIERLRLTNAGPLSQERLNELSDRYQDLLDAAENHSDADYGAVAARRREATFGIEGAPSNSRSSRWYFARSATLAVPYLTLSVPILLIGRLLWWCFFG